MLNPGTYYTGSYDEVHLVQCTVVTMREPLNALTSDGVQFRIDVYVRFSANCADASVMKILQAIRDRFIKRMKQVGQEMVSVHDISLANLDFPEEMNR